MSDGALVHSLWLTGQGCTRFLRQETAIITETRQRNEKSRRSHARTRKRPQPAAEAQV